MHTFKTLLTISSFVFLASCATSRLVNISSENAQITDKGYVFENDTVRITYKFWAKKGIMSFDIYNKLNQPLFIDLKNSAFIPNDKMISYWQDVTNTESAFKATSYDLFFVERTKGKSTSKSVRQERIIVASPRSMITNAQYSLIRNHKEVTQIGSFEKSNSPLRFRNFLAFSTNEKFEGNVFYVDNSFFVSTITKLKSLDIPKKKKNDSFFSSE